MYKLIEIKNIQSRFKSPVAWGAITALILFVLKNYGLLRFFGLNEYSFEELSTLIFAVLTALGIFNDPTNKDKF